jgi:oxygen-independent coproporphyrinogen-3 oxidase
LGRLHSTDEALRAIEIAQNAFDRVSFDLIYARQNQSLEDWATELDRALRIGTSHLSLYQLTIEDGTAFGDRYAIGKLRGLPEEDTAADMFELTQEKTTAAGLPAYEVSNHAVPGEESRHNLIYWRGGDYLGVGPGAHGRLTVGGKRFATETPLSPTVWLKAVEDTGSGSRAQSVISDSEKDTEYLMMALRTSEGADLIRLTERADLINSINRLRENGFLKKEATRISVPAQKRILLNAILKELLT